MGKRKRQYGKKQSPGGWVSFLACVLVLAVLGLLVFMFLGGEDARAQADLPRKGSLYPQDYYETPLPEGAVAVRMPAEIACSSRQNVPLCLEYPEANTYPVKLTLRLEDGTLLYRSAKIQPGEILETITLRILPDPGEYRAAAQFTAVDPDTGEEVGTAEQAFLLRVENGSNL